MGDYMVPYHELLARFLIFIHVAVLTESAHISTVNVYSNGNGIFLSVTKFNR